MRSEAVLKQESISVQESDGKSFRSELAARPTYLLIYATGGAGGWRLGTATGYRTSGAFLALRPPGLPASWRFEGVRVVGIELAFSVDCLPRRILGLPEMAAVAALLGDGQSGLVFEVPDRERLEARLRSVGRASGALRLARLFAALELVSGYQRRKALEGESVTSMRAAQKSSRLHAAMRFIEERFADEIGRDEVAAAVSMEPAAFSRFFRKEAGVAFVDYLAVLRARHAATLLGSRRDLSLSEVARRSGFRRLGAFHQQFRKRLGTTPASYRRAANAEVQAP